MTKTKTPRKKKAKAPPEEYWSSLITTLIAFRVAKFGETGAVLDRSTPRDLKAIVIALRMNAESISAMWTKEIACRTLLYFLEFSWVYTPKELVFPKTREWFLVYANKYKAEILEQIRIFKLQKTKTNENI